MCHSAISKRKPHNVTRQTEGIGSWHQPIDVPCLAKNPTSFNHGLSTAKHHSDSHSPRHISILHRTHSHTVPFRRFVQRINFP